MRVSIAYWFSPTLLSFVLFLSACQAYGMNFNTPKRRQENSSRRHFWTPEEIMLLEKAVSKRGENDWRGVACDVPGRSAKQCHQRWANHKPGIKEGPLSPWEWDKVLKGKAAHGRRWALIAESIPGRTPNQIKNAWYTWQRKNREFDDEYLEEPAFKKRRIDREQAREVDSAELAETAAFLELWWLASSLVENESLEHCGARN